MNEMNYISQSALLKVGLLVPTWVGAFAGKTPGWQDLLGFAHHAENVGFDSVWVVDDLFYKFDTGEKIGLWECWSVLSAMAASTTRLTLGSLVSCNNFRHPALLAKIADTVDEISGGRLVLGIGAGGDQKQHEAFGFPWERCFSRFEEALTIIHSLLRTGVVDFQGEFYQLRECELDPRGPRPRSIPILVGTESPGPRMLRLAAQYADSWNCLQAFDRSVPEEISPYSLALDQACESQGRAPETLERTATISVAMGNDPIHFGTYDLTAGSLRGSPEEIVAAFLAYAQQGITHLQVYLTPTTRASIDAFVPVLILLAKYQADSILNVSPVQL